MKKTLIHRTGVVLLGCALSLLNTACSGSFLGVQDGDDTSKVTLLEIPGVNAPFAGAIPVTSFETSQYKGTVNWSPTVQDVFTATTAYTATITLNPGKGYTLSGIAANGFKVAGATTTNAKNSGVVTAAFPTTATTITDLAIPYLAAPVAGATPITTIDASQYTGTVSWSPAISDAFAVSTAYSATIKLTPKTGYTSYGVTANSFTVAGGSAKNTANSGEVSAVFSITANTVSVLAIPGVPAPVTGATPITTLDTSKYTGTVSWSPAVSGTFAASTTYTATITLSPKEGETLIGIAANSFMVAGATATNAANSGVVTAMFPETAAIVISELAISGVNAPVTGAIPVTSIDASQYTGTVSWSPAVSGTFNPVVTYTATITLTPKHGYTVSGVAANGFTVTGATSTNSANSGIVNTRFPRTAAGVYTSLTMISVPAGTFQRDGTATNTSTVSAFRMSKYEITRQQFLAIMGIDPSDTSCSTGTTDPVQNVNWYHAIAFCNKLSIAEGLTPVYAVSGVDFTTLTYAEIPTNTTDTTWDGATATWANNGYRLPTKMEWTWAGMGATGTGINTTGYLKGYAGSTEGAGKTLIGNYAWHTGNSSGTTHPVGIKTPNELGLCDMTGNVLEWCWDLHTFTTLVGSVIDYRGETTGGVNREVRGGSWNMDSPSVGSVTVVNQGWQANNRGLRVVRNP